MGTPEHPFWVPSAQRWKTLELLRAGDTVQLQDGSHGVVADVRDRLAPTLVYNIEVQNGHSYFVSDGDDDGALVHNESCWQRILRQADRPVPEHLINNPKLHAHHIVMKGFFNRWLTHNSKWVREAQNILAKAGIDINDADNLAWKANEGHTVDYAKKVYERLKKARDAAIADGSDSGAAVRTELKKLGGELESPTGLSP